MAPGIALPILAAAASPAAEATGAPPGAAAPAAPQPETRPGAASAPPRIDRPAPDFALSDLRGILVESAYGSRPVTVVHFWATWCVPCMLDIPELNRLAATYEPAGAAVYAVALSSGTAGELRQLERAYDIRHRVLLGDQAIANALGGFE